MLLVLLTLALLVASLVVPALIDATRRRRSRRPRSRRRRPSELVALGDPGRERRAEQRARELLRSCVNEEEWAMYRDLGFLRVFGRDPGRDGIEGAPRRTAEGRQPGATLAHARPSRPGNGDPPSPEEPLGGTPRYAYLLYPHKPILAYEPRSRRLLSEYCVEFPEFSDAMTGARLPDSDDVLAKWMALTGDEGRLLRDANMHLPGRQLDPGRVRRDLWRLEEWDRRRGRSPHAPSR